MSRISGRHLATTGLIAMAVHAGFAISVLWAPPPAGAIAQGLGGVEVNLGPAGGAPGDTAQPATETPQVPVAKPEEVPVEAPPVPVAEPAPPEQVTEAPAVPVTEPAIPEPPVVEAVATPMAPPARIADAQPVAPPKPRPRLKPKPPEPQRITPPAATDIPAPDAAATATPVREQVARTAPSVAGSAGKSGIQDRSDTGAADATAGGGAPGASADYMSYLLAWLQKHKEYPQSARRRRQQGTALLYFEMDRDGHIHTASLRQSSGYTALGDEARALIRRAEPLPPPPPEVIGERIRLVVPVQFFLR